MTIKISVCNWSGDNVSMPLFDHVELKWPRLLWFMAFRMEIVKLFEVKP